MAPAFTVLPGALNGASLVVKVHDDAGSALPGALVGLYGPNLAVGNTDSSGQVTLDHLPAGSYHLRVEIDGRVPFATDLTVATPAKAPTINSPRQLITMDATATVAPYQISGRVVDPQGQGLAGARVVAGDSWTMTDDQGNYQIASATGGAATIRKTGFSSALTPGGTVTLSVGNRKVSFESDPFGGSLGPASTAFSTLRGALSSAGWTVVDQDHSAEVRIWAAPASTTATEASDLLSFVSSGGKLLALADWGGAGNYRSDALNLLLLPLGTAVNTDLVRDPSSALGKPEWLAPLLPPSPASSGVNSVALYGAATVNAAPPNRLFALAPSSGYRVQSGETLTLGLARQVGPGLVVVVGDCDAWLNKNIGQANNLAFITNLVNW